MNQVGEDVWDIPGQGDIEIERKVKRGGLSQKYLKDQLPSVLNVSADQAKETVEQLLDQRPSEDVVNLKFNMDSDLKDKMLNPEN